MKVGPGTFLIANPELLDPNFRRTVVLLCNHGPEGSLGLVVNRPMNAPLAKIFPGLEELGGEAGIAFCGGPVETNRWMALRRGRDDAGTKLMEQVFDGVQLVLDIDALLGEVLRAEAPTERYRFFLGYAGWGEDQLASELREGAWIVRPATDRLVFHTPASEIWGTALREMGGKYRLYAEMPVDPNLN